MSTKHAIAAARFLENKENEAWHDHTLWMVRTKRDKMSHSLPEWERLRELASEIKLYSNSHLDTLLEEFEKNAIANGAIVHWAKDAEEHNEIITFMKHFFSSMKKCYDNSTIHFILWI